MICPTCGTQLADDAATIIKFPVRSKGRYWFYLKCHFIHNPAIVCDGEEGNKALFLRSIGWNEDGTPCTQLERLAVASLYQSYNSRNQSKGE